MAYGQVRGTLERRMTSKGEIIIELGLSTIGTDGPARDAYFPTESGVTGHVVVSQDIKPKALGPLYFIRTVYESWAAA